MKLYRFGNFGKCFPILIEEENGEVRTATVGLTRVVEHIGRQHVTNSGAIRLVYGGGSSIPYKNSDGTINERWVEITNGV